jgi:spore germination protein YaaH
MTPMLRASGDTAAGSSARVIERATAARYRLARAGLGSNARAGAGRRARSARHPVSTTRNYPVLVATRTRWVFAVAALVLSACQPNRFVSGWVPYWGGPNGRASIEEPGVSSLMSDLSPLWHQTDDDGTVDSYGNNSGLAATVATMQSQGVPVIPAIFDSQGTGVMSSILADPVKRTNHVQHIVNLVIDNGYDGIDLDYEVFAFGNPKIQWPTITGHWVAFVQELAGQLHARGKLLSVTVPPVWDFTPGDGNLSGYTVYAQGQIAPFVDRLRLMVYDWNISNPGPIAPMFWVNAVIAYSSAQVPTSKLQLGVPTYGRHWETKANSAEVCPDGAVTRSSVLMRNAAALAAANNVVPTRHTDGELTFTWNEVVTGTRGAPSPPPVWVPPSTVATAVTTPATGSLQPAIRLTPPNLVVTCTIKHTVFVPDAVSVRARAEAALAAGWSGIALFAIGYESLDIYQSLAGIAPQRAGGDPFGVITELEVTGNAVRLTGHAVHPEFDLPVPVRFTFTVGGNQVGTVTVLARDEVADMPTGTGPFHGFDELVPLAAGSYTVCADVLQWGGGVEASMGCQQFIIGT